MYNTKGPIFNIQRFSTSDGPGIRTTVFMKGCPLKCVWCHNPESGSTKPEIFFKKDLCIGCKGCISVCQTDSHNFETAHSINRSNCIACGRCAEICPSNALELCGEEKTVKEIIDIIIRDSAFYEESSGGVTLSGGEPLMHYDFTLALLKAAKENGLHTAIETCGFTNRDLSVLNGLLDLWLFDIKLFDDKEHIKYTGVSNKIIFENLRFLDSIGAKIILRCPIIPDINLNTEHFRQIAKLANSLKNIIEINLEPYHPLGISKLEQLDKPKKYQNTNFLEVPELLPFLEILHSETSVKVSVV